LLEGAFELFGEVVSEDYLAQANKLTIFFTGGVGNEYFYRLLGQEYILYFDGADIENIHPLITKKCRLSVKNEYKETESGYLSPF
jgi:hypothetical protein